AARLTGPDPGLRAELAVAGLVGLGAMYGVARGPHLRESDVETIADRYGPLVQAQLTPEGRPGPHLLDGHRVTSWLLLILGVARHGGYLPWLVEAVVAWYLLCWYGLPLWTRRTHTTRSRD